MSGTMSAATPIDIRRVAVPPKSRTLWAWLRDAVLSVDAGADDAGGGRDAVAVAPAQLAGCAYADADRAAAAVSPDDGVAPAADGVVLPFPIHGEALLVRLADVLRNRIRDRGPERDPLLLQLSRSPRSRLSIDRAAHVEFHHERCEYRAVIEAQPGTKVILETTDFDALVDFIVRYLTERLVESAGLEAAS